MVQEQYDFGPGACLCVLLPCVLRDWRRSGDRHVDTFTISSSVCRRRALQVARYVRLGIDHVVTSLCSLFGDCPFRISTGIPNVQTGVFRGFFSVPHVVAGIVLYSKFGTPYVDTSCIHSSAHLMCNNLYAQFGTPYVGHSVYTVWHTLCGTFCIHSLAHLMWNILYTQFGTSYV